MQRQRNEHSIAQECELGGRGYWSGQRVTVRFLPAGAGTGIVFRRVDLPGEPEVAVDIAARQEQPLRTVISRGRVRVAMIEHVMAALYGLEIDNCVVEVDAEELPGLDGSSAAYVDALRSAGLVMQAVLRRRIVVDRVVRVGSAAAWVEASPSLDGQMHLQYSLDYGPEHPVPAQQFACSLSPELFTRGLASARTFVTAEQVEQLRRAGVGGHVTPRDLLVFDESGPIANLLRFTDECARHKVLDLVGDLALSGAELVGKFVSYRGGHQLNAAMVRQLCRMAASQGMGCRRAA